MTGTTILSRQRQSKYFQSLFWRRIIAAVIGIVGMLVFGFVDILNEEFQFFISPIDWLNLLWGAFLAMTLAGLALAMYWGRKQDKLSRR